MKVLFEQSLVNHLRVMMNGAKERVWVSSPYIGSKDFVSHALGNSWLNSARLDIRLLTDIAESTHISHDTIDTFLKVGKVKSLLGLHAKIYIADNSVLVTSSNLTRAAYTQRYEMGVLLEEADARDAIEQYEVWWNLEKSETISIDLVEGLRKQGAFNDSEPITARKLPVLFSLPTVVEFGGRGDNGNLSGYDYFIQSYNSLSEKYRSLQRLFPSMPLYFEVDGLLDYLFHHGAELSKPYGRYPKTEVIEPRNLAGETLMAEISKCAKLYKEWVGSDEKKVTYRLDRSNTIRSILNPSQISKLDTIKLRQVADCLNCMNSYAINKERFLNTKNNEIRVVISNFNYLLHGEDDHLKRMRKCRDDLMYFGNSSVQELIGFYYPDKFPLRNGNSNAGLRFFGFDVSI